MRADILILGQGLAGTVLAWELERAGISFEMVDDGHAHAATLAAAGIINPITGRRLVKSWRFEAFMPVARSTYREMEAALGVPLWREMRVRRWFADEQERVTARDKHARSDLAPYIEATDDSGWWIRDAARVDLAALLSAARMKWSAKGNLRTEAADVDRELERHDVVIDCRGVTTAESKPFDFVPWEFSKGEVLELAVAGLDAGVILNRRFWITPTGEGRAMAGATHEPGQRDRRLSDAARKTIEEAVRELLGPERLFSVVSQRGGVRVNLRDKRPITGRHPSQPKLGLINALGAKGALWAPMLARAWSSHLAAGTPFDAEVDVRRFA